MVSKAYSFFRQKGFIPIGRESFAVFKQYENCSDLAEMSAVMITTWSGDFHGLYQIIGRHLCSVYFHDDRPVYFLIHRPLSSESGRYPLHHIIDTLYGLAAEARCPVFQIRFADELFRKELEALDDYSITTEYHDSDSEYILRPGDILDLEGRANKEKRYLLRKCGKMAEAENFFLIPLTGENVHLCLAIEEEWCRGRDCVRCSSFWGCEKKALEIMIALFDERVHRGFILYHCEKPVGYIVGERRDEHLAFLWYGKAILNDFFVYLIHAMAERYLSGSKLINIGEDMGNAGLRVFKRHLGAHTFLRKYICTFRTRPYCLGN